MAPSDTLIDVFDIVGGYAPDAHVDGPPAAAIGGLPLVGGPVGGAPRVTPVGGPAPRSLVSRVLVAGTGLVVRPGATVTMQYVGARRRDGSVFDSSYAPGGPNAFDLLPGAVVPGWAEGLIGRRVGSRVMLVVPSPMERAFVATPGGVAAPGGTANVHVIDILSAG